MSSFIPHRTIALSLLVAATMATSSCGRTSFGAGSKKESDKTKAGQKDGESGGSESSGETVGESDAGKPGGGKPGSGKPGGDNAVGTKPGGGNSGGGTTAGGNSGGGTTAGGNSGGDKASGTSAGGTSAGGTPAGGTPAGGTPAGGANGQGTGAGLSPEAKKVIAACAAGAKKTQTSLIDFEATDGGEVSICRWKSNPVGSDDTIRGILSQSKSIALPPGAVLCSSRLFSANAKTWKYDDEIVLTLNDVILMTSQKGYIKPKNAANSTLEQSSGSWIFDWDKVAALNFLNNHARPEDKFCYGNDSSTCEIPVTEKVGVVRLDLPVEVLAPLSAKVGSDKKMDFTLWITGDNDPKIDCKHSGIELKVDLEYVVP